jgi:hypothetical protein
MSDLNADAVLSILDSPSDLGSSNDSAADVETPTEVESTDTADDIEVESDPVEGQEDADLDDDPAPDSEPAEEPEPAAPKPLQAEGEFDSEIGPPRVTESGGKKEWRWPENRAKTIYAGYEEAKKFRDIAATPEEAGIYRNAYVDLLAMSNHLRSNDPGKVDRVLDYWHKQSGGKSLEDGVVRMVSDAKAFPTLRKAVSEEILRSVAEEFYSEYQNAGNKDSEEAQKFLFGARVLDWRRTGSYRSDEEVSRLPKPDPADERLAEANRKMKEVEDFRASQAKEAWNAWNNSTQEETRKGLFSDVEAALKPIEHLKKDKPRMYKAAVDDLMGEVRKAIEADASFRSLYSLRTEEAARSMSADDRKNLVDMFRNRARRVINGSATTVINGLGVDLQKTSQETHERLAKGQDRKEAGGKAPSRTKVASPTSDLKTVGAKVNKLLGL